MLSVQAVPAEDARAAARVLIVDDDPRLAKLLEAILRPEGFDCLVAHDGDQAWQLLTPEVSLVLLDLMMPGESGPAILRRMQMDPILAKIPVIFVSGRSDAATRIQCLATGAQGFVVKPFEVEPLVAQVRSVLARSGDDTGLDLDDTDPLEAALGLEPGTSAAGSLDVLLGGGRASSAQLLQGLLAERQVLKRRLDASYRLLSAILRLHQMANVGLPIERVAQGIVQLMHKVLGVNDAVVWLPRDGALHAVASLVPAPREALVIDGPSLPARAWRDWQTVESDPSDAGEHDLHVPLTVGAEAVGVLSARVASATRPSASLAAFFCAEAAVALEASIRLPNVQREALTDALTGLCNRRYLDQRLEEEFRRAKSLGFPLSVLFLDVDHFKELNDRYGHQCGDRVLCMIARVLREALRGVDVVARYGGEEFVMLLPETTHEGGHLVAEKVRALIPRRGSKEVPEVGPVSVTIGVATAPLDARDPATLVARADEAMLRGKRAGRNRVEAFALRSSDTVLRTAAVIRVLLQHLARKDPQTYRHSLAVGALSARLARRMGLDEAEVGSIGRGGLLHDIGKLYTPDEILLKPGPLTPAERLIMQEHAIDGAELAAAHPATRDLAALVRASQEAFDGSGYPDGLVGDAIPLGARIITVTDAYHAMSSDRPYRAAMLPALVVDELGRHAGTQFDPAVVRTLLDLLGLQPAA